MSGRGRLSATGALVLLAACALSSCSSSPTARQKAAVKSILTTTTTTTTAAPATSSTSASATAPPGVAVPNVIGLKIAATRGALHAAGLPSVSLNLPCNKGTLASQSVASSLSIPGKPPNLSLGAVPLMAGARVPPGTRVGITWSGCYGNGSAVPDVIGLTFSAARHALHAVGLTWACFSVGKPTTTTTTTASSSSTSTTTAAATTTSTRAPQSVLSQDPAVGTVLKPGATVNITMHACPQ